MRTVVRVVPAAGAGRRMGRTKALLDFDGITALALVLRLDLGGRIARDVVVVGHDGEAVAAEARRLGAEAIVNPRWDDGQTGSVRVGIARALELGADAVAVHPVDLPLVSQATYDACAAVADDAVIAVPSHAMRRGHPLIVVREVAEEILGLPPDAPARDVVRARGADVVHVEVDDPWVLRDLDRPEDHAAALDAFRAR